MKDLVSEGFANVVKPYIDNEIATRAKLGAHNRLPLSIDVIKSNNTSGVWNDNVYTIANVTITLMVDDFNNVTGVKLNGTSSETIDFTLVKNFALPSGNYILNTPNQFPGDLSLYLSLATPAITLNIRTDTSIAFSQSSNTVGRSYIYAGSGRIFDNFVIQPMICLASDTDSTYQPYAKTNQQLTLDTNTIVNDLGAKNLARYSLPTNPYTVLGTTFTQNEDNSVSISGTYDGSNHFINLNSALVLDKGTYKLTDGDDGTYPFIRLRDQNDQMIIQKEGTFTLAEKTSVKLQISFGGESGATANSKLYPMIRPASIEDDTYVPYAMTNRELTEELTIKDVSGYSWDSAIDGNKDITVKRYGAIVSVYGYFRSTTSLAQYADILSGLPHCASGAAKSTDASRNMGMTLQNVDSATSKIIVDSATTADLQYAFNFVYLTDK